MDNDRAKKSLRELTEEYIEDVCQEICESYCKYPEQWDEEKEGMELSESDICANCPLNRLQEVDDGETEYKAKKFAEQNQCAGQMTIDDWMKEWEEEHGETE